MPVGVVWFQPKLFLLSSCAPTFCTVFYSIGSEYGSGFGWLGFPVKFPGEICGKYDVVVVLGRGESGLLKRVGFCTVI